MALLDIYAFTEILMFGLHCSAESYREE